MTTMTPEQRLAERDKEMIPIVLVRAMLILALTSLALVAFARVTDRPLVGVAPDVPIVAERTILLEPDGTGTVFVVSPEGETLARSDANRAGFIETVWRVVGRKRMLEGAPAGAPIRVVRRENGKIALIDDSTGWTLELIGYGQDNVAAFARLVD